MEPKNLLSMLDYDKDQQIQALEDRIARLEDEHQQSEARFRSFFEHAGIGVTITTFDGTVVESNSAIQEMLGYTAEELAGMNFAMFTHREDLPGERVLINTLIRGQRDHFSYEKRHVGKDKRVYWVRLHASVIRGANAVPLNILRVVERIDERKQAEEQLLESRHFNQQIMTLAPYGVYVYDVEQQCNVFANEFIAKMVNIPLDVMQTADVDLFKRFYTPASLEKWADFIEQLLANPDEVFHDDFQIRDGGGQLRWIRVWITAFMREPDGRVNQIMGVVLDVTEQLLVQQRDIAYQVERERTTFLAQFTRDAFHEFRTPLTIIGTSSHLLSRVTEDESRRRYAKQIEEQIADLTSLLNDLVTMTRLDGGDSFKFEVIDVRMILQQLDGTLTPVAAQKGISLHIDVPQKATEIHADADRLYQAVGRIADNALRYTSSGGHVRIELHTEHEGLVFTVVDTGIGMEPDVLPNIFERFSRRDPARGSRGFGLGLPIAKKIIEEHGGRIEVQSEVGVGTVMRVILPLA